MFVCFTEQLKFVVCLLQIWRLVANFFFLGKPSINFLLKMLWL